jgi:hypothetical protein
MRFGNLLLDPLMRSGSIEVLDIGVEYPVELLLLQDEQMIEALATHASEKAFTSRIRSRGLIGYFENLDATRVRNTSEVYPKLTIVITKKILWSLSIGRGFSQLLRDPGVARRACDADMDHFARVQVDDEERKERTEQQVGDWQARHRPRSAQHGCAGRSSSSVPLAESSAPVACPSGWFVCRCEDPV